MNKAVKVLLIEDSEDDARLAVRMLRRGGFEPSYRRVQDEPSLQQALRDERWDAILSDYRLPCRFQQTIRLGAMHKRQFLKLFSTATQHCERLDWICQPDKSRKTTAM